MATEAAAATEQQQYEKPLPPITKLNAPFWEGTKRGELRLQTCNECSQQWYPPSTHCPNCLSRDWEWKAVSGKGKVWSYVIVNRPGHPGLADVVPYNASLVQMDDEPDFIYLTNIVDADETEIQVGLPVEVVFEQHEKITVPRFKKA